MPSNGVGPGAVTEADINIKPLLDSLPASKYVEILNPLSEAFFAKVSSSVPIEAPVRIVTSPDTPTDTRTEGDLARNYGLSGFKNPDHQSLGHIAQTVKINPGSTIRLPAAEAKVVIRQLVNEVMAREKRQLFMADPTARNEVEQRLVIHIGDQNEFYGAPSIDVRKELNKDLEAVNEPEFPAATQEFTGEDSGSQPETGQPEHRSKRGRPPKAANSLGD